MRRERGRTLFVFGPAAASVGLGVLPQHALTWHTALLFAAGLSAIPAGLLLEMRPGLGRACAAFATLCGIAALHEILLGDPAVVVGFGALLTVVYLYAFVEPVPASEMVAPAPRSDHPARLGLLLSAAACFAVVVEERHTPALAGAGVASLAASVVAARWARTHEAPLWSRLSVGVVIGIGLALALVSRDPSSAATFIGGAQLIAAALVHGPEVDASPSASSSLFAHPARVLVVTFAALCGLGAVSLALPASGAAGTSVGFLDAAFTSVSAVCVTGLAVLDTPNDFSAFGQAAIALLIQVGGLGIMTFYTVALAVMGRRLSLRHERALAGALNIEERDRLVVSVRTIFLVTGVAELVGALVLFARFAMTKGACAVTSACVAGATCVDGACVDSIGQAAWRAAFTSISAFCNAGFALQSDSLVAYQSDPVVLHTVGALIVLGGLSPPAVVLIPRWLRGERLPFQVSLIVWSSLALLVSGALAYGLMEWTASLAELEWFDRLGNAWFQSVTLRTAGFNSVDLAATRPATQALMTVFMFIGGSPGSTAGGVKTTTIAILILTVAAALRGQDDATAFGRRVGRRTVYKAAAVMTVGSIMVFVALIGIELTQAIEPQVAVFEVVSALGTVGLSLGATGQLDEVGKVIIIVCMFAGRVGPLTLFLFLSERPRNDRDVAQEEIEYLEAEVDVG
ncbi:MAG: TrkH family potassium uptake protein [Sandaracinaceae bacterium]